MSLKDKLKNRELLYFLIFMLVPVIFYLKYILADQLLVSGDGACYFNNRNFINQSIWNGSFPLWNKYLEGGLPYGAYETSAFYPVNLILGFLPPAVFSYVSYFVHLFIGASFMYLFLKEIKCNEKAAFVVALIYETSIHINGWRKSHMGIIVAIIFLPVIFYFVQKYLNSGDIKWLIISSFMMAFQFMGAHTQYVLYTDVAVFFYLISSLIYNKKIKSSLKDIILWFFTYVVLALLNLYPTIRVIMGMNEFDSQTMSIEGLKSYSIHFIKLIQMAFPYIFGNEMLDSYQYLGISYSSEMDNELFLGLFVLICILFCAIKFHKRFEVRFSLVIMSMVFLYAAHAHIPYLSEIIYRIPLLKDFRCPSRALFVFIFLEFILLAVCLTELKLEENMSTFFSFSVKAGGVILFIAGVFSFSMILSSPSDTGVLNSISKRFSGAFAAVLVIIVLFMIYKNFINSEERKRKFYSIFCSILMLTTIAETYKLSNATVSENADYFDPDDSEIIKELSQSEYKLLDGFIGVDGGNRGILGLNAALNKRVMGYNAYVAYNNPRIYHAFSSSDSFAMNSSGLLSGFPYLNDLLNYRNDLLSILGIRYIADPNNVVANNRYFVTDFDVTEQILYDDAQFVIYPNYEYNTCDHVMDLDNSTLYRIDFNMTGDIPEVVVIDFYGSDGNDGYDQAVTKADESDHYYAYYKTSADNVYSDCNVRIITNNTSELYVSNFSLSKCSGYGFTDDEPEYSFDKIEVAGSLDGSLSVSSNPIDIDPNEDYLFTFDITGDAIPSILFMDLYEVTSGYDYAEQEKVLQLTPGETGSYSFVLNSGDCPEGDIELRFVSDSSLPVSVTDLRIYKGDTENKYSLYYSGEEGMIYENPNAKPLLFTLDNVVPVDKDLDIYDNITEYDLLSSAYALDYPADRSFEGVQTEITNTDFGTNAITANVTSDKDTFVLFSQCYYDGWRAFVDGEEVPVYIVDNVIMGADVPAGSHKIEFRYSIPFFGLTIVVYIGIHIAWMVWFILKSKKKANADADTSKSADSSTSEA